MIYEWMLTFVLELGIGVEKNEEEAAKWYKLAAEMGNCFGMNSLAYMYEDGASASLLTSLLTTLFIGIGIGKNETLAAYWYKKAAELGYSWSQCNYGYCLQNVCRVISFYDAHYSQGIGTDKDECDGAQWYMKAARQGHSRAMHNLGFCYQNVRGASIYRVDLTICTGHWCRA